MHKGLNELEAVGLAQTAHTRAHIGQPSGCSPIATAIIEDAAEIVHQVPETLAQSLAIGAPGDGPLVVDAVRSRSGSAAAVPDGEIITAMELLAATEGVLTEPAGGTTLAATMKLAQQGVIRPDDTVVVVISGNGLKTLSEQPVRPWPERIPCNPAAMEEVVNDFRQVRRRRRPLATSPRSRASATAGSARAGSTSTSPKRGRATTSSSACTAGPSTGTSGGT